MHDQDRDTATTAKLSTDIFFIKPVLTSWEMAVRTGIIAIFPHATLLCLRA